MKIAIVGAAGRQGQLLVKEAVSRGHQVTAIVRQMNVQFASEVSIIVKDLFDLVYEDIKNFEAIIDASAIRKEDFSMNSQTSIKHLADLVSGHENIRLLIVGGAGSLYAGPDHPIRLWETPHFPQEFRQTSMQTAKALDDLDKRTDINWTCICPPPFFDVDGARTGKYVIGKDEVFTNSKGEFRISYADFAIAMIDEVENFRHIKSRFTVVSE